LLLGAVSIGYWIVTEQLGAQVEELMD